MNIITLTPAEPTTSSDTQSAEPLFHREETDAASALASNAEVIAQEECAASTNPQQPATDAEDLTSSDDGLSEANPPGKKQVESATRQLLSKLAIEINAAAAEMADKSIKLGNLLLKSRGCFAQDKNGREEWMTWVRESIRLSTSRVGDLMRIAKAADPAAEKRKQNAKGANRQKKHRNKHKTAALAALAKYDSLSDTAESPKPDERQILTEKIVDRVRNWARGKSVSELQRVISEFIDSGDGFPEMPAFLIRNKSALAASATSGAVTQRR